MPKRKSPPETPKKTDESQTTWKLLWWSVIAIVGLAVLSESLPRRPRKATETTPAGQGKTRTPSAKPVENEVAPPLSVNFKPFNVMGAELFTSFMVTCPEELTGITRTNFGIPVYGNGKTFGVVLKNVKKGETYKVTAKANGIINESVVVARISQDDPFIVVLTPIRANYNELAKVRQTIPMDFVFAVSKNNSEPTEQAQRWTVHQINDCPTLVTISTITRRGKLSPIETNGRTLSPASSMRTTPGLTPSCTTPSNMEGVKRS